MHLLFAFLPLSNVYIEACHDVQYLRLPWDMIRCRPGSYGGKFACRLSLLGILRAREGIRTQRHSPGCARCFFYSVVSIPAEASQIAYQSPLSLAGVSPLCLRITQQGTWNLSIEERYYLQSTFGSAMICYSPHSLCVSSDANRASANGPEKSPTQKPLGTTSMSILTKVSN